MFGFLVKRSSHKACAIAEVLLVWPVRNVNKVECGKRYFHKIGKKNLFPQSSALFKGNKIPLKEIICKESNVVSAISQSDITNKNRKFHTESASYLGIVDMLALHRWESKLFLRVDILSPIYQVSCDVEEFLQRHNIFISGKNPVPPFLTIEDAGFSNEITSVLSNLGIFEPTPIQSLAWTYGLEGRDFVGVSKTGSGKTLGYVIPAILHLKKLKQENIPTNKSPVVLVLAPTRELVQQIGGVVGKFKDFSFKCACLYGGSSRERQYSQIMMGLDICIATPGRLLDFMQSNALSLRCCSFVVIDEADRMLDMGFLPDVIKIMEGLKKEKQVLMWSATWPEEVHSIAERFLSDHILAAVGSTDLKPNSNVHQIVKVCKVEDKKNELVHMLQKLRSEDKRAKLLVFAETKIGVNYLEDFLRRKSFPVSSVHGGKTQMQRTNALRAFREGRTNILLATAVAARGLDIKDITHVINYDCPKYMEEYIHKIGRTARHEKKGIAITFVTPADKSCKYLINILKEAKQEIPEELHSIAQYSELSFTSSGTKRRNSMPRKKFDNRRRYWN